MDLLHDLSIRTKMIMAFAIVLACTAGIGLFTTQKLEAVSATGEDIRNNWLPSTRILEDIGYSTTRYRSFQSAYALAPSAEDRMGDQALMAGALTKAEAAFAMYETMVSAGEERRLPAWCMDRAVVLRRRVT